MLLSLQLLSLLLLLLLLLIEVLECILLLRLDNGHIIKQVERIPPLLGLVATLYLLLLLLLTLPTGVLLIPLEHHLLLHTTLLTPLSLITPVPEG